MCTWIRSCVQLSPFVVKFSKFLVITNLCRIFVVVVVVVAAATAAAAAAIAAVVAAEAI